MLLTQLVMAKHEDTWFFTEEGLEVHGRVVGLRPIKTGLSLCIKTVQGPTLRIRWKMPASRAAFTAKVVKFS
jgi:hypothetical protein